MAVRAGEAGISNLSVLMRHDEQLLRQGLRAEKRFAADPNTCLLKLRELEMQQASRRKAN